MYKVIIVDDEPLVQAGIKSMLNCDKLNIEICGIAGNGETALELIEAQHPDIVICDIKMPKMTGLELIKICVERYGYCNPVFIFLTSFEEFQLAKEALTYQASDYLIKLELTPEVLSDAVNKAKDRVVNTNPQHSVFNSEDDEFFIKNEEKFYIRLLQNMFDSPEQFKLQSEFLNINLNADFYQCAYLEFFDHTGNHLSSGKQFSLFLSSFHLLTELIQRYITAKVISLDIKHCALLIEVKKADNGFFPDTARITEILKILLDSLHKYYNTTFRAGIGSIVNTPMNIAASYQYARQAFFFTDDTKNFCFIEDCNFIDHEHQIFNLSLFRDALSQTFEEFDEVKLCEIISQLNKIFLEYPNHIFQAMDAACSILYMAISSIPNGEQTMADLFSDYPDYYRSIYRQHTTEQIADWLNVFGEKLSGYFTERKNTHTNHTVNSVKRYINEHISEKLTLNDVAFRFNITPNYLSQLFKKYNDSGFNEYVTMTKIEEAKKRMAEGTMKIYEISDSLGFESSFYFSKVFKKLEGISPKDYMNQKLV